MPLLGLLSPFRVFCFLQYPPSTSNTQDQQKALIEFLELPGHCAVQLHCTQDLPNLFLVELSFWALVHFYSCMLQFAKLWGLGTDL